MTARTLLTGGRVITANGLTEALDVVIVDGRIEALVPNGSATGETVLDVAGRLLSPGFIDLQLNGGWGHDFTTDPESIADVAQRLAATGVTAFLPTIVTAPSDRRRAAIAAVSSLTARPGSAAVLGLHFEGPLINPERAGAHERRSVGAIDDGEVDSWSPASGVALVTIAPEVDGALAAISGLAARGVVVSAGHTACSPEQFLAGRRAGLSMVTHLFNAMAPFEHRQPGPVGATLADATVAASLICDGIHVHPTAVLMAWNALGPGRMVLVTDATAALGVEPGPHRLGTVGITISGDRLETADGTLAGSTLTLDRAVRNLLAFTGCTPGEALGTVTANPARLLGLPDRGTITPGSRADLVVLDAQLGVERTIIGGITAWQRDPVDGADG
jgi:N-acetylglucosamine-6-phosphate deacetylase